MSLLIIVLAITLIIGSMMWILPSAREKRQMQLRRAAQASGLRVQLVKLDFKGILEPISCTAYSLSRHRGEKAKDLWKYYNKNTDHTEQQSAWQSSVDNVTRPLFEPLNDPEPGHLEEILAELPHDWLAVEQRSDATVLYWLERGEEESVAQIARVLKTLQEL